MLTQETISIIKSTVPVLEVHGTTITKRFYELLFEGHPELLNIFNHMNQKKGHQQTALANAIYAAAVHIDQLEAILPVVKQIGHKHRSLGVKPEHYPIVGTTLLQAIKEVLGDGATDEIITAWGKAYGVIADAFIGVEQEMYREAKEQLGGWDGFREFYIAKKVRESNLITSFYFKPVDQKEIASFKSGQYITVKVKPTDDPHTHLRQYSLSDAPDQEYYRISVKRERAVDERPQGVVSSYLHEASVGDVILLSAPAGDFTLDSTKETPVVLISGGVGLTPMISMLNHLVTKQPNRHVTFIHTTANRETHAMAHHVQQLAQHHNNLEQFVTYSRPTEQDRQENNFFKEGYLTREALDSMISDKKADIYLCGPVPFMKDIHRYLCEISIPSTNIHYEFFGPAVNL